MTIVRHVRGLVRTALLLWGALLVYVQCSTAQTDLENVLKQYDATALAGYAQPMADLFGANMNSGLYQSAAIPTTGLSIRLTIVGMGSLVSDEQEMYTLNLPSSFSQRTMEAPTIFGPRATLVRDPGTGLEFRPSDGIIDASLFPLAVPQLTVGSVFGTEATVRFIATPTIGDGKFPNTSLWGIGARHSISQYFSEVPLDIAAGFFYSGFTVGDIVDASAVSIGAQAGKNLGLIDLFGGIAWENSTMNFSYQSNAAGEPTVDVDLDGENNFRFTAGAALNLGGFRVSADANFGSVTNFSAGLGFGF